MSKLVLAKIDETGKMERPMNMSIPRGIPEMITALAVSLAVQAGSYTLCLINLSR